MSDLELRGARRALRSRTPRCRRSCSACASPRRSGAPVHAIALRCQIRIEPQRRRYRTDETEDVWSSCSANPRSGASRCARSSWTHVATTVPGVHRRRPRSTSRSRAPTTSRSSGTRYFHSLADGEIPLLLLFSGTTFVAGDDGLSVTPVAWHEEASYRLPVSVWQAMMDLYLPEPGWLSPSAARPSTRSLRFQAARALPTWDLVVERLLKEAGEAALTSTRPIRRGARAVADAVLYEGYVLYPYRASAPKNQVRWQLGVLFPRAFAEADGSERWRSRTECIVDPGPTPQLTVRVRWLQVQRRSIEAARAGAAAASWCRVAELRGRRRPVGAVGRGGRAGARSPRQCRLLPLAAASSEERDRRAPAARQSRSCVPSDGTVLGSRAPPA